MANGSFIAVSPGSGAKLATSATYTENSNVVQDEKVIFGENYVATYMISGVAFASLGTANAHLLQIMAGASLGVRIRRIEIWQFGLATTATFASIYVFRLTSAGSGGTASTPSALDSSDAASGATAMTLPSVKGTESGNNIGFVAPYMVQTAGASSQFHTPVAVIDYDRPRSKPLIIPAGTANGIAVKSTTAIAGASVALNVWFDETSF